MLIMSLIMINIYSIVGRSYLVLIMEIKTYIVNNMYRRLCQLVMYYH
jgi:hypothetical protein